MMVLRQRTVGARFTVLYAALFLSSGMGLLGLTFLFSGRKITAIAAPSGSPAADNLAAAQQRIGQLEDQLAAVHTQQVQGMAIGSAVALIVLGVMSLGLGRIMAQQVLAPLRLITSATQRISAENLDRRLDVIGPADEVKDLADTIDELLGRLEASFAAQRRFVANASHELRTPLATMRASLDVAIAKFDPPATTVALAGRVRVQLDRIERLLDGFLMLARAQHGALADTGPVRLSGLVDAALGERSSDVRAKDLDVVVEVGSRAVVQGSPALLSRLVGNLVDNAVTHNEPGGWIRITGRAGPPVVLDVESGGPVLDQEEVERLAEPFERLGAGPTGSSGLGLSIVAAVAAAHRGRLALTARPAGGLAVTVTLPAITRIWAEPPSTRAPLTVPASDEPAVAVLSRASGARPEGAE